MAGKKCNSIFFFFIILLLSIIIIQSSRADDRGSEDLGRTTVEIIRSRGFNAENHYVTTTDGYIINVIRATNPLITVELKNKQVLLFVHGILTNGNCFVVNSLGAFPQDYSYLNASQISDDDLYEEFKDNPNSKSLVFFALIMGHEVWIVHRRGTKYSQGHVNASYTPFLNSTTNNDNNLYDIIKRNPLGAAIDQYAHLFSNPEFLATQANPLYWDFRIDTEAKYDIPNIIDYVLAKTGRKKLTYVGHSLGASLPLFALYINPKLGDKSKF